MPRGELTDRARTVITVCAVAAVLYAAITPFFYRDLTYAFADVDSIPGMLLVRAIIVGVPNLLALAAVVLSGQTTGCRSSVRRSWGRGAAAADLMVWLRAGRHPAARRAWPGCSLGMLSR